MYNDQYSEDKLSVLDIAKSFAGAAVNPLYAARYNPNFWSPRSYNGIQIGSVFQRGTVLNNKYTRGIYDKILDVTTGSTKAVRERAKRLKFHGIQKYTSFGDKVDKMSNGILHYTDGYLGFNMGRTIDFTGAKQSVFHKKMLRRIASSNRQIDEITKIKNALNTGGFAGGKLNSPIYEQYRTGFGPSSPWASRVRKPFKKLFSLFDDEVLASSQTTAELKNHLNGFRGGRLVNMAKIDRSMAYAGIAANYAGRFAGKALLKTGLAIGKGSAYLAVADLMYQGIKMVMNPIAQAGVNAIDNTFNSIESFIKPEIGGKLNMDFISQGAATERQRAIQAISKSRINGRSVMGSEAQYMHA